MSRPRSSSDIENVTVIGAGTMGAQIASLAAFSGRTVKVYDAVPGALTGGFERIQSEILPSIEQRSLITGTAAEARSRLSPATTLESAVDGADFVIEVIREDLETKRTLFRQLSPLTDAILSTNSSSLPSSLLADSVEKPERLLNTHFFAPIWVRNMLEVMSCGKTDDNVFQTTLDFGRSMGLLTAAVQKESKGFIINRIWRAVKRESLRVIDEDVADPEDVDRLWMMFFQTDYPPFGVMDTVGLDVVRDIESTYQAVTEDPTDIPSDKLAKLIERGDLGEKSGQGFYQHPEPAYKQTDFLDVESRSDAC